MKTFIVALLVIVFYGLIGAAVSGCSDTESINHTVSGEVDANVNVGETFIFQIDGTVYVEDSRNGQCVKIDVSATYPTIRTALDVADTYVVTPYSQNDLYNCNRDT